MSPTVDKEPKHSPKFCHMRSLCNPDLPHKLAHHTRTHPHDMANVYCLGFRF